MDPPPSSCDWEDEPSYQGRLTSSTIIDITPIRPRPTFRIEAAK